MRISFLLTKCTSDNSHGRYVIELAKHLGTEHSIRISAGAFWPPLRSMVDCRHLPVMQRPLVARLATLWTASALTTRGRPGDIVHVQGADAPFGNVVTAHCCNQVLQAEANHGATLYRKFNYFIGAAAEKRCMSRTSAVRIIAVSRQLKGEIEREYGVDPEKVVVIHHGVDTETFHPRHRTNARQEVRDRLGLSEDTFAVLFVGGDYRLKGLLPLLQAASLVPGRLKVLAVGVIPDVSLRRHVHREGLSDHVAFIHSTTEMAPLYAAADCFALPTRYDTFSLATLEAMASGLPVVVSRNAGVCEILSHDRDSLLLGASNSTDELTLYLDRLVRDEQLRARLGAEARHTAERHSWDRVAAETLEVYRQAVADSA